MYERFSEEELVPQLVSRHKHGARVRSNRVDQTGAAVESAGDGVG